MQEIRIAIIGHGFMGHEDEKMLLKMPGIRLVGFSDIDPKQLEDVAPGLKRYASNEELLADPEVDVVIIAANNNQHHKLVCQAARAGKDILCEKPVAMTVAELDDMIRVVNECGVKFTVHHQRRFDPDFRTIKEVFDHHQVGDVYMVKTGLYGFNGNMHDWHVYKSEGGGMLYDWGVHLLDQMLWMMPGAKIKQVFADVRNVINFEVDDYFKIILRMDNGITAEVELGTYLLTDKAQDMLPSDRKDNSVLPDMSLMENMALAGYNLSALPVRVDRKGERARYGQYQAELNIRAADPGMPVTALSGGNQQKVFLARWLDTGAEILLLDNPTQGIDVGAKAEIYRLILQLSEQGKTILVNTLEIPELRQVADRCAVFYEGGVVAILNHDEIEEQRVMRPLWIRTPGILPTSCGCGNAPKQPTEPTPTACLA